MREDVKSDTRPKMHQELDTPGKIMITGIPKRENYAEAELEKEFAPYGRITEVNIIRDKRTSIPRGFAFITYENPQDSEDAIKAMEGKDLGGDSAVHCEQAVIGYRKSKRMNEEEQGLRGGPRGRGGRGFERGRGRGMDRGRGMFNRGRRGGLQRGRGGFDEGMGRMYPEEEYYEEYYEPEPAYVEFPPRGGPLFRGGPPGRGGPPFRGGPPGRRGVPQRGRPFGQGPTVRGGRKVLLPDPPVRGLMQGPPQEEYYGDEDNGYTGGDYYSGQDNLSAEDYEEPYSEEVEYPAEEYYDREWSQRGRNRGAVLHHGRGLAPRGGTEVRAAHRIQVEDYGYPAEVTPHQRSRAPAGPGPVSRRSAPGYSEEMYENSVMAPTPVDPFSRGRGRPPSSAVPTASSARLARETPGSRGGAVPVKRRTALLDPDPYMQEDPGMYERAAPPSVKAAAPAAIDYDEDAYGDAFRRKISLAAARQAVPRRTALLPSDDIYAADRVKPIAALIGGDAKTARRAVIGAASRYIDDYQSLEAAQARDAYAEGRRPVVRRMTQDPYQRVAAETDAYVSYPSSSRAPPELMSSDPYNRKRSMDVYDDTPDMSGRAAPRHRREFDDYRSPPAVPMKRERIDRGERSIFDTFTSRQEGAYRDL